jgi:hypothetical protein
MWAPRGGTRGGTGAGTAGQTPWPMSGQTPCRAGEHPLRRGASLVPPRANPSRERVNGACFEANSGAVEGNPRRDASGRGLESGIRGCPGNPYWPTRGGEPSRRVSHPPWHSFVSRALPGIIPTAGSNRDVTESFRRGGEPAVGTELMPRSLSELETEGIPTSIPVVGGGVDKPDVTQRSSASSGARGLAQPSR